MPGCRKGLGYGRKTRREAPREPADTSAEDNARQQQRLTVARHFPHGRPTRRLGVPSHRTGWLAALAASVALALTASVISPSFAGRDDDLRDKRSDVSRDLRSAHKHLDHSSAELVESTRALARAQGRLDTARTVLADTRGQLAVAVQRDRQMQAELDAAEARLAAAEQALVDGKQEVSDTRDELAAFVVNSYQYGNPTLISLGAVLNGDDPTDFGERLSLADSVAGAQTATLDDLRAATTLLSIRQDQVAEMRDDVAARRAAAAANLQHKTELEAAAEEQTAAVRALVEDRRTAKTRADRAKQADLRQIAQLERERERMQEMLQRLARRDPGPTITVPEVQGEGGGEGEAEAGGFLSMPLSNSYITSSYGMRMHPILRIYKLHDGTDFGAGCGTPLYASAAGTVVSQYYDGGYGNRVIIAHGRVNGVNLATSYNHLTRSVVGTGARVERGQLIGYVGTTGYSTGCHLHFMVYENGVTVNPMGWL